jgi:predicted ABC-type transport system involved in lysophospholipase L1 biosynthesis ATPase subunit
VHEPRILFADEPTGNLDSVTGGEIMKLLARLNRDRGLTVVMVTHDERVARQADRVLRLADGRLRAPPY